MKKKKKKHRPYILHTIHANCKAIYLHFHTFECLANANIISIRNLILFETVEAYFSRRFTRLQDVSINHSISTICIRIFWWRRKSNNNRKVKSTFHNSCLNENPNAKKKQQNNNILRLARANKPFSVAMTPTSLLTYTDTMAHKHTVMKWTALMYLKCCHCHFRNWKQRTNIYSTQAHIILTIKTKTRLIFAAILKLQFKWKRLLSISIKIAKEKTAKKVKQFLRFGK